MKKNNKLIINCTTDQKEKIKNQAEKIGLTLQEYILKIALNTEIIIKIQSR